MDNQEQINQEIIVKGQIKKETDEKIELLESMNQSYDSLQAVTKLKEASIWIGMDIERLEASKEDL